MLSLEEIYPPYALRISSENLELRVMRDEDFPELVELIHRGIQDDDLPMPFLSNWHQQQFAPGQPEAFPASSLSWWWAQRATFAPEAWQLALTVRLDGELVGMQDMNAKSFLLKRTVDTGSWLGRAHQGRGVGTKMRQLAVIFAFTELGAQACTSSYVVGNHASAAVSRKCGYVENGRNRIVQQSAAGKIGVLEQRVIVTPETFVSPDTQIHIEGGQVLRTFFGIAG